LENFEEVAQILKKLAETPYEIPNEDGDLRVNAAATDAQLAWSGKGELIGDKKPSREDFEVFEATFNAACTCVASSKFGQAAVLLKRARRTNTASPCESLGMTDCVSCRIVQQSRRSYSRGERIGIGAR
jgi:hypothetical protein